MNVAIYGAQLALAGGIALMAMVSLLSAAVLLTVGGLLLARRWIAALPKPACVLARLSLMPGWDGGALRRSSVFQASTPSRAPPVRLRKSDWDPRVQVPLN